MKKSTREKKETRFDKAGLDAVIEEITVDAYGDAEQLWAFRQAFEDNIALPSQGFAMGAPVSVLGRGMTKKTSFNGGHWV